jgi:protoheme IX farnesyltransferase
VAQDAPLSRGLPSPHERLSDLAALGKLRISLLSTLSAATGFLAASRELRAPLLAVLSGTFLLAAGAAALNEVLDRDRDARMERTRGRPIPAGRISVAAALALALLATAVGAALLGAGAGPLPALLGVGALLWYDAVYTPLKRVTAFAVLPGAIVGALPPAIGWTAAGGGLADAGLLPLCAFFLLWQVPHFWLLSLRHAEDFERGGFPTPASRFSPAQAGRITFVWTLATGALALLLPLFGVTRSAPGAYGLAGAAAALLPFAWRLLRRPERPERVAGAFAAVNLLAVALMAIVSADALLGR